MIADEKNENGENENDDWTMADLLDELSSHWTTIQTLLLLLKEQQ